MAKIIYRTRGNSNPKGKPKVYFTCYPSDFELYFNKICEDIFKTHDCAIYYKENMNEIVENADKETDLGSMSLFVVPVTFELLTKSNVAMDDDLVYANKEHIPILPFMMESGIDKLYSKPNKFGEKQYINPFSHDITEISYEDKLKKHLESVLISDEMAKRVRVAFDAYIFLSYRKKDRRYANELMKLIHKNPECRDIAIWYDEFLTPGESFKDSIDKMLNDSKLFTLLVTPNLLEEPDGKPNFVMAEEYPKAKKKSDQTGMEIIPAEMERTDVDALKSKYIGIPECVNPHEDEMFQERLLNAITKIAKATNEDDPEHNFLIGLAYLDGIDVEVNRERAVQLITSAANSDLLEATNKLVEMYNTGKAVRHDIAQAIYWQKKSAEHLYRKCVESSGGKEDRLALIYALHDLADLFVKQFNDKKAIEVLYEAKRDAANMMVYLPDIEGPIAYAKTYKKMAEIYVRQSDVKKAETAAQTCLGKIFEIMEYYHRLGNMHGNALVGELFDDQSSCLLVLGDCCAYYGDMETATQYYVASTQYTSKNNALGNKLNKYFALIKAGDSFFLLGHIEKASEKYQDAYILIKSIAEEISLEEMYLTQCECEDRIGNVYLNAGEIKNAIAYYEKSFLYRKERHEINHKFSIARGLAKSYIYLSECYKALDDKEKYLTYFSSGASLSAHLADNVESIEIELDMAEIYHKMGLAYYRLYLSSMDDDVLKSAEMCYCAECDIREKQMLEVGTRQVNLSDMLDFSTMYKKIENREMTKEESSEMWRNGLLFARNSESVAFKDYKLDDLLMIGAGHAIHRKQLAECYYEQGLLCMLNKKHPLAIEHFQKSIIIYQKLVNDTKIVGVKSSLMDCYHVIGSAFVYLDDKDTADGFFEKAVMGRNDIARNSPTVSNCYQLVESSYRLGLLRKDGSLLRSAMSVLEDIIKTCPSNEHYRRFANEIKDSLYMVEKDTEEKSTNNSQIKAPQNTKQSFLSKLFGKKSTK